MIFDIKIDGKLTRKNKLISNGHKMDAPAIITYLSVVEREIVMIYFLIASLNVLDICACDMGNAYHSMNYREKLWTVMYKQSDPSDRG